MIGELLPDQPARDNPGLLQAKNVYPYAGAYRPVRGFQADTNALDSTCLGAAVLINSVGTVYNYAGDAGKVYTRSGDTWSSVDTGFTATRWEFARFYDTVLAVNGIDPLQQGVFGGTLADVTTAPDSPKTLCVARNFTIVGNYTAAGTFSADAAGVAWSALGAPTTWGSLESDSQHLDECGEVVKLIGGEYVTVLCERGVYRMIYVGNQPYWQFDLVEGAKGCIYQGMVANVGHDVYYLGQDGFYRFDGVTSHPISSTRLSQTFYDDFDVDNASLCTSIADPENNLIIFGYPGQGHTGVANRQYIYNYVENRWAGPIEREVQMFTYSQEPGVTVDSVATAVDHASLAGVYVDDPSYQGGDRPQVSAFIPGNYHALQTGAVKVALIESGEYAFADGKHAYVSGFRPIVEGATTGISGAVDYRNSTGGTITRRTLVPMNSRTGVIDNRISARYHRFRLQVSSDFDSISGGEPILAGGPR